MAFEQYFAKEWKSIPAAAADSEKISDSFACNICLDFARDPVVTLCGHLYCWPCIYRWFHVQSASHDSDEPPQCPVCKADIFDSTVVPLYGRGETPSEAEPDDKAPSNDMIIPPRPPACGTQALINPSNPGHQLSYQTPYQNSQRYPHSFGLYEGDSSIPSYNLGVSTENDVFHLVVGMLGNSENLYTYPNSYHSVENSSPRLRRQEMQADKSLYRVSMFLFCCFLLCLLLF